MSFRVQISIYVVTFYEIVSDFQFLPEKRVVSLAPLAQPQRTAPFSKFRGGRPCLDVVRLLTNVYTSEKEFSSRLVYDLL